jgi:hypothetical protein
MNLGLHQKLIVRNFGQILIVFLTKNKENDKDISMEVLYNYLENLNKNNFDDGNIDIDIDVNNLSPEMDNILNSPITIEEIKNVVKGLKNGKSSCIDGVINEYIKYTIDDMLHIYVLLFNIILDKGIIPESWGKGILIPIFKNKGSKSDISICHSLM